MGLSLYIRVTWGRDPQLFWASDWYWSMACRNQATQQGVSLNVMCLNHPQTLFHKTGPWCQNRVGTTEGDRLWCPTHSWWIKYNSLIWDWEPGIDTGLKAPQLSCCPAGSSASLSHPCPIVRSYFPLLQNRAVSQRLLLSQGEGQELPPRCTCLPVGQATVLIPLLLPGYLSLMQGHSWLPSPRRYLTVDQVCPSFIQENNSPPAHQFPGSDAWGLTRLLGFHVRFSFRLPEIPQVSLFEVIHLELNSDHSVLLIMFL